MKNNISYYRHEVSSHNHWKFKTLRRKYTWSGEGKFWALNNIIAESPECRLDINDDDKKAAIAAELDFDVPEFETFITYLIKVCKLVKMEEGMLITGITQEILSEVSEKRERQRNWKKEKSTSNNEKSTTFSKESVSKTDVSTVEKQQSKVNKIKVNKSKKGIGHAPTNKKVFTPPDIMQVQDYFLSTIGNKKNNNPWPEDKCFNEASSFLDHYTANGWVQGRGKKIVDWKAACRNWMRNELKGSFKQAPIVKKDTPPPHKSTPPPVDKIQMELNYLQDMFSEDETKVTTISIDPVHYDYLKQKGKINFTAEKKTEIKQLAATQLNGSSTEQALLNMMKRIGVIEYFKQNKETKNAEAK